ncbi:tetratricopeptide repeat protein [Alicyclobacillus tolerans]|uniref:Tetratricopeptide (TPR) repeat protein n=1 Tax=Alicyclobacillus tolerans TaxID=90970 RepID=A0ABT9LV53_9BACL|nr:tetratricopeptide repeat protein [Alicyclobacillus tengchongensis]MDP9728159.1 tetratricopeptide (TPR) repeat protein [Alicyclobacillus tengchongensis]
MSHPSFSSKKLFRTGKQQVYSKRLSEFAQTQSISIQHPQLANPTHDLLQKACAYYELQLYTSAKEIFQKITNIYPHPDIYCLLTSCCIYLNDLDEAQIYLEEIISFSNPKYRASIWQLSAELALQQNHYLAAIVALRQYLKYKPMDGGVWKVLGLCLLTEKKYREALFVFFRYARLTPPDADTLLLLAYTFCKCGNDIRAMEIVRAALKQFPYHEYLALLGSFLAFRLQRPLEGLKYCHRVLYLQPEHPIAHMHVYLHKWYNTQHSVH